MADVLTTLASELSGHFSQHRRMLRLSIPGCETLLLAESLRGEEALDTVFRFRLTALSTDASIPLKTLLGQPALVELHTAGLASGPRPFHGHVTAAELLGANGGFARYQLTIEPWTAFLGLGRDSRVFQDRTVFDILDTVFTSYDGKGTLAPAWRFAIADRSVYPRRSLVTQYQESDLAFVRRLMSEEGLFFFFEHEGDASSSSAGLGCHTLVIADHNGVFVPNAQPNVWFTQASAVMQEDSLDRWRVESQLLTNAIELVSWDYRACKGRKAASGAYEGERLCSRDVPGAYAFSSSAQGQRIADNQMQGLEARMERFIGAGTVRSFMPGSTFNLLGHDVCADRYTILRVCHLAHNNLDADTGAALGRLLGSNAVHDANDADLGASPHLTRLEAGGRPVYRNRIDAIRSSVPYRPSHLDAHGRLLHPRPLVNGQQTAIVVGPSGAVIHTDRDHRIKVQFHWQRGKGSHSRLDHPSPDGHGGAPADDRAGTWVRAVAPLAPVAGANWGGAALPRVGQEVLVDFLDGDIDRPVVIATLYNGRGKPDAQHNEAAYGAGAAIGSAPAWFPGASGGHAHPAALSGIKSQAMAASQDGLGAYSQLVFDDSAGQARVGLQRHGTAHDGSAELNLGYLRHQSDNGLLNTVGSGIELKTAHSVAIRAGQGLLLSGEAGIAAADQLDARAAIDQLTQSHQMQVELATQAQKHNAGIKDEPEPEKLAALMEMAKSADVLNKRGAVTAYGASQLQLSGPAGIVGCTPADAVFTAGETIDLSAGEDANFVAQGNAFHVVKTGISFFTYGKSTSRTKPSQETGIRLHAASGHVSAQSQSGTSRLIAEKALTVASVTTTVNVAARKHVLLTAQGAYLKIEGGNIELHGPGKIDFKATKKEFSGPARLRPTLPVLPKTSEIESPQETYSTRIDAAELFYDLGDMTGVEYMVIKEDGSTAGGKLDQYGRTGRIISSSPENLTFLIGDGDWEVIKKFDYD